MSGSEESGGGHLILETLVAIVILLFYTISAPLFEKYHFHYMHESGMCMIIGVIITLLGGFLSGNVIFIFIKMFCKIDNFSKNIS